MWPKAEGLRVLKMGAYKYIKETLENEYKERSPEYRARVIQWRKEPTIMRVERPSNLIRARSLGYKAKQGIAVVRVKMGKGRRKRVSPHRARKAKTNYSYDALDKSLRVIAEEKAARKHSNMEVLNSYWVGEDGQYRYFEIILAERGNPSLPGYMQDTISNRGRAYRGLTSAGRKGRGLRAKGLSAKRTRSAKKERESGHDRK
jgi:large subunit ribosomal protein L15e